MQDKTLDVIASQEHAGPFILLLLIEDPAFRFPMAWNVAVSARNPKETPHVLDLERKCLVFASPVGPCSRIFEARDEFEAYSSNK